MKKFYLTIYCVFIFVFSIKAQNVGINEPTPGSKLSVKGNLSVGNSYSNLTIGLPANGLIVEGNVGIGLSNPSSQLHTTGTVRFQNLGGSGNRYVRTDNNGLLSGTTTVPWTDITGAPAFITSFTEVDPTWNGAANETGNIGRTGRVGIGTLSPQTTMHISGNAALLNLEGSNHGYIQWYPQQFGAGRKAWMGFGTSGTNTLTIANEVTDAHIVLSPTGINGRVGVGTTSPAFKLDVAGDIRADNGWIRTTGNTGWISDTWGGGWAMTDATWIRSQGNKSIYHNTGTMRTDGTFQVGSGGATFNVVNGGDLSYRTNVLYANTAGNVGIGTASPSAKLEVVGPATGSGATIRAAGGGDVVLNSGGSLFFDGNYSYASGNYVRPLSANTQGFFTSGAERLRIASNGNIGISNTAPAERLHVSGNVLASGIVYWGNTGTRTETRSDAGLQGNAGARSGFYETSAPSPAANWPAGASSWWHLLDIRHSNAANNYALQFAGSFFNQDLFFRKTDNNPATPWSKIATVENTYGSNIKSVTSNTDVSTTSSSFAAIPDMTITFTPIHSVVYVTFSASGNHTGTISAAQFAHFRIVKDGIVQKGTSAPVGEFDDFDGGHNVWNVSFTYPVAVTPGVATTIRIDWAYFRRFTNQVLWVRPSVEPVVHHRHLMILD